MDNSTRDRIRALVRDVLDKSIPADASSRPDAPVTSSRFVDIVPANPATSSETTEIRDESSKTIITEDDVRDLTAGATLRIGEDARLTPLAADIVSEKRIEIVRRVSRRGSKTLRMIAVGADHGGFKMKEELKTLLTELGQQVHDFGTNSEEPVDYPDLAYAVARSVSEGTSDLGIVIDGAGVGSAMTANKVPGVRAAACYSVEVARNSREHNGANVLSLGSKTITSAQMREIVQAWLATDLTEERHRKRVAKIQAIEKQYLS
ncbi:MAG TPA: RpiB/LacA/LacB family sugar-phosphate isomerase [Pyrinomonadaceae bacterium]|jgi:ribose 5-phosphate isomerase B|nr:RpiB/LacA/LacB family sugar-phosphate isomerase [Pyrinomonadaceae bacterium]